MANTHETLTDLFSDIATSVRAKTGSTSTIVADNFPSAIDSITTLKEGSNDATATAAQILSGQTAYVKGAKVTGSMANQGAKTSALNAGGSYTIPAGYHNGSGKITANSLASQTSGTATTADMLNGKIAWVNGNKVTGNIPTRTADNLTASGATVTVPAGYYGAQLTKSVATATQATPSISIDTAGKITASATQSAGYVSSGTKSATKQLTVQAAKTVTPSTSNQTAVSSGVYTTGAVTVAGDADLVAANIKSGVDIFGVTGTYVAPTDTTATAAQILTGKTAYLGGAKTTGTMANRGAVTQTLNAGGSYTIPAGYHNGSGKVTANSLASQTDGTAVAADILSGQTAYVDGVQITGTMPNVGAIYREMSAGSGYTIPKGYHNGSGTILAKDLPSQTSATAVAGDILSDKTAWVNGVKLTGTIATKTSSDLTASGAKVTVPAGYYASDATKSVASGSVGTPSISVNASGKISVSVKGNAGYISTVTKSNSKQLTTQAATTITPSTSAQTAIATGTYAIGDVTVAGDADLVAGNIKSGVNIFGVTGSYVAPDDSLFLENTTTMSVDDWYSITYGNGKFVAIASGSNNCVAYSTDGIKWHNSNIFDRLWRSVTYGKNRFVAVGALGDGAYSFDGITWITSDDMLYKNRSAVAYGNGTFVTVSYGYNAEYSTDGVTWTATELPTTLNWQSIVYGNGKFVAVGQPSDDLEMTDVAAYSLDGINWVEITLPSSEKWYTICYGNRQFVAIADSGATAYSADGINWTAGGTMPNTGYYWNCATYGNGKFVALGYAGAYSTDGITWTELSLPSSKSWKSVVYGNGLFVAVAANSNTFMYSVDGITWSNSMNVTNIVNLSEMNMIEHISQELDFTNAFAKASESWVGNLTYSGQYATSTYFTRAGCYLAVDKEQGMAFVTTASPNSTAWDRIHYQEFFAPDGITVLAGDPYPRTQTSTAAAVRYFTVAFKGVTGKINANVELYSVDSSYDTVYARVTLTYA